MVSEKVREKTARYGCFILEQGHAAMVEAYCEDLIISGQHRLRFPSFVDPTPPKLAHKLLTGPTVTSGVYDTQESRMCGEMTLEGNQGLSHFIHYSSHSSYHGLTAVRISRQAINWLFKWKIAATPEVPYVTTLVGLTPVDNVLAVRFARALGFKKQFILKDAVYQADTDKYVDCMVSTRTH